MNPTIVRDRMYSNLGNTIKNQQFSDSEERFMKYLRTTIITKKLNRSIDIESIPKRLKFKRKIISSSFHSIGRSNSELVLGEF